MLAPALAHKQGGTARALDCYAGVPSVLATCRKRINESAILARLVRGRLIRIVFMIGMRTVV